MVLARLYGREYADGYACGVGVCVAAGCKAREEAVIELYYVIGVQVLLNIFFAALALRSGYQRDKIRAERDGAIDVMVATEKAQLERELEELEWGQ